MIEPTDEQIVRIIAIFAEPEDCREENTQWWGYDTTLGCTSYLVEQVRCILRGNVDADEPTSTKAFDVYGMYPTRGE